MLKFDFLQLKFDSQHVFRAFQGILLAHTIQQAEHTLRQAGSALSQRLKVGEGLRARWIFTYEQNTQDSAETIDIGARRKWKCACDDFWCHIASPCLPYCIETLLAFYTGSQPGCSKIQERYLAISPDHYVWRPHITENDGLGKCMQKVKPFA